jgi:hypothetical protein
MNALFVNFVFCVLAEQLGLEIPGTDPLWFSTFQAASMLFGLIGTAAAAAIAPRGRNLTSLIVGNVLLIVAVFTLSGWRSISGFVLAMSLLNFAVTFLTPAALCALSAMDRQGAQWAILPVSAVTASGLRSSQPWSFISPSRGSSSRRWAGCC